MGSKARDYKRSTIRLLDILSGNECAAPDCARQLVARDGETIVSKICHIEAASENGPRYNPDMNDDERRHFNNLILLCDECHSIIDNKNNEDQYPVELLKQWKEFHESRQKLSILANNPRLLNQAINGIAELELDEDLPGDDSMETFGITQKIEYNEIKRNKSLIDEYAVYYPKINVLYGELEEQGSFKKTKLLRNIKLIYTRVKGRYIEGEKDEMDIIRENSDNIIEEVENELLEMVDEQHSQPDDVAFAIPIIMVDAFMRCKILEEPRGL